VPIAAADIGLFLPRQRDLEVALRFVQGRSDFSRGPVRAFGGAFDRADV
jgi:hypothetical protein